MDLPPVPKYMGLVPASEGVAVASETDRRSARRRSKFNRLRRRHELASLVSRAVRESLAWRVSERRGEPVSERPSSPTKSPSSSSKSSTPDFSSPRRPYGGAGVLSAVASIVRRISRSLSRSINNAGDRDSWRYGTLVFFKRVLNFLKYPMYAAMVVLGVYSATQQVFLYAYDHGIAMAAIAYEMFGQEK